jgi:hypothetical protein
MEENTKKQIKFKDWLILKGLKPDNSIHSEYFSTFLKETGASPEAIKQMENYRNDLDIKEKKAENFFKNLEKYIPIVITVIILLIDYVVSFLPKDWRIILFIVLGIEILVIFIQNTVKKAVAKNK